MLVKKYRASLVNILECSSKLRKYYIQKYQILSMLNVGSAAINYSTPFIGSNGKQKQSSGAGSASRRNLTLQTIIINIKRTQFSSLENGIEWQLKTQERTFNPLIPRTLSGLINLYVTFAVKTARTSVKQGSSVSAADRTPTSQVTMQTSARTASKK